MADGLPTVDIPRFGYEGGTINLGQSYAQGMQAGTQAGEALGKGISSAFETMTQNRYADDTLAALNKTGVLSNDAYQAVAGKSLGAKQTILGMYAGQWINEQAQLRELQKAGYAGAVDVARQKAIQQNQFELALDAIRKGYPAAAGIETKKILAQPGATTPGQQAAAVQPQLIGPSGPLPAPAVTPQQAQQAQQIAGTTAAPTPLGSGNIYSPGPKLGAPISRNDKQPPGSTLVLGKGPKGETQHFVKLPDGTLQPIQG